MNETKYDNSFKKNDELIKTKPLMIDIQFGEMKLKPIVYTVRQERESPWWWRRTVWYIECEFGSVGPFSDPTEVSDTLDMFNRWQ